MNLVDIPEHLSVGLEQKFPNKKYGIDYTGQKFKDMEVIGFAGIKHKKRAWLCKCICGTQKIIIHYNIPLMRHCGKCRLKPRIPDSVKLVDCFLDISDLDRNYPVGFNFINYSGVERENFKIINLLGMDKKRHTVWLAECKCGNQFRIKSCDVFRIKLGCVKCRNKYIRHNGPIFIECNGFKLSLRRWAIKLNIPRTTLQYRVKKYKELNRPLEELIARLLEEEIEVISEQICNRR